MIEFNFYCPACQQPANAKADPVDLLFVTLGQAELFITCTNCDAKFKADTKLTPSGTGIKLGERVPDGDGEA